ncbi:MAG: DUF5668 domain-containing protein [Chloroflexota bacterium]|nr:DUF5668 domain-containing protein [Chloroflexota bacterium]MDE2940996.1 DUF5668 domain-containing protein [Chloroflexota bacterium]MDE3268237.1 DUF5668 domain-containing protein [Chloroflexota bacterium]
MFGRKYAGAVLVLLGTVFLVGSLTGVDLSLWKWWPALLISAGIVSISKGNWKGGLIVVGLFSAILLSNLGVWSIDVSALWPVLLIALGLAIFFGSKQSSRRDTVDASQKLKVDSLFSESNQQADGDGFTGGTVSATFGSAEVDLRSAVVVGSSATVDASVMFGSVTLRVPPDWAVDIQSSVMFGSIETKRPEPAEPKARLVVTGSCWFGEIQVTS